jgi:hypothetical protein
MIIVIIVGKKNWKYYYSVFMVIGEGRWGWGGAGGGCLPATSERSIERASDYLWQNYLSVDARADGSIMLVEVHTPT